MIRLIDNIPIDNRIKLYRTLLKIKTEEFDISLSNSHISLIIDFHMHGVNDSTYKMHIDNKENHKNYFKSKATVDNAKTFLKKVGVLVPHQDSLRVSENYLPVLDDDKVLVVVNLKYHDN